jgi:hypothetical protein
VQAIGGVRVFKVRWLGYGAEHDSWEPAEMVSEILYGCRAPFKVD